MTFWSKVAPLSICVWIFSVFWLSRQSCASITPVCLWRAIMSFQLSRLASFTVYAIEGKLVFNQFAPHSPLCICIRLVSFLYFIYHQFYTHIDTHDERKPPHCHLNSKNRAFQTHKSQTKSCPFLVTRPVLESPCRALHIHTNLFTIRDRFRKGFSNLLDF